MTKKRTPLNRIQEGIEAYLPMTLGSFLIFLAILYFLYIVSKTTLENYQSNKSIEVEEEKIVALETELEHMRNQINYFKTKSFKEKEAREKLGFKAPGEKMMSVPIDQIEAVSDGAVIGPEKVRVPNYRLWLEYYSGGH